MDIQLRQHNRNRFCFVTDEVKETHRAISADKHNAKRRLVFKAEFVRHRQGDNVPDGEETIAAAEFSAWWEKMRKKGWRICPSI